MKAFILLFVLVGSVSAWAGDHHLHGDDAAKMAKILDDSGYRTLWDVTIGFVSVQNPYCSGLNYVDQCVATPADILPAAKPAAIKASDAQEFWGLLKKAGFNNEPGKGNDSGKVAISASRIDCSVNVDESQDDCTIQ